MLLLLPALEGAQAYQASQQTQIPKEQPERGRRAHERKLHVRRRPL
jgi:hypothetical protein